jgi:hypothetical protein
MRPISLLAALAGFAAGPAAAFPNEACFKPSTWATSTEYPHQVQIFRGLDNGRPVLLSVNPRSRKWMLLAFESERICIIAVGEEFERLIDGMDDLLPKR